MARRAQNKKIRNLGIVSYYVEKEFSQFFFFLGTMGNLGILFLAFLIIPQFFKIKEE